MGVVAVVIKGSSKEVLVMHLLCRLWFFVVQNIINFRIEHIAGISNETTGHLSHFYMNLIQSTGQPAPNHSVTRAYVTSSNEWSRLDIPNLQAAIHNQGLAPSTHKLYQADQKYYFSYSQEAHRMALPASEDTLMMFTSHLAQEGLAQPTFKVYMSAVRHLHVSLGLHSQFTLALSQGWIC